MQYSLIEHCSFELGSMQIVLDCILQSTKSRNGVQICIFELPNKIATDFATLIKWSKKKESDYIDLHVFSNHIIFAILVSFFQI